MKFSTVALFTSMAAAVFAAPTAVQKRDDASAGASPVGGVGGLGAFLGVLAPVQQAIGGLVPGLGASDLKGDQAANIVKQITSQLTGLTGGLGGLGGSQIKGQDAQTAAQQVAGVVNQVTGALAGAEKTLGGIAPELEGPLNDLNTALNGVLSCATGLVADLNNLLTPLLAPVTSVLAGILGGVLPFKVGLLGL